MPYVIRRSRDGAYATAGGGLSGLVPSGYSFKLSEADVFLTKEEALRNLIQGEHIADLRECSGGGQ